MTRLDSLYIDGVRNLSAQQISLSPGLNFFCGLNGAGKTSVLEAVYLLSRGRSHRALTARGLIQRDRDVALVRANAGSSVIAIERRLSSWIARQDGEDIPSLAQLARILPVVMFHPESHGAFLTESDQRRRLLDWTVFHVEPGFAGAWSAYQRALKQRNAALSSNKPRDAQLWDAALAEPGETLTRMRASTVAALHPAFLVAHAELAGLPDTVALEWRSGWDPSLSMRQALVAARERDTALGYSSVGAHRCDLLMSALRLRAAGTLSRGEGKLAVLALTLAASEIVKKALDQPLLVLLDDIAAELDPPRFARLLSLLSDAKHQVLATAVEPPILASWRGERALFHVEQGRISRVL